MSNGRPLIPPHGGYRDLRAFQAAEAIYDGTVAFTGLYFNGRSRTVDQMVQAARSGRQNIAEGSRASGTSKKTELKLVNVARASLDELLLDYEDFLRQKSLPVWEKDDPKAVFIRNIGKRLSAESRRKNLTDRTDPTDQTDSKHRTDLTDPSDPSDPSDSPQKQTPYSHYRLYIEEKGPANAANTLICLIHQANFLLDRLLRQLEKDFVEEGGFTEKLYRTRTQSRRG